MVVHGIDLLHKIADLWPEVFGGGVAYFVHTLCHGLYHRVGHAVVRLAPRRTGGGHS